MGRLKRGAFGQLQAAAPDPWLTSGGGRQPGDLTRRAAWLLRLVLGGLLAAAVLSALVLVLIIFAVQGSRVAAWLLTATLLLAVLGLMWGARRAGRLLRGPAASVEGPQGTLAQDEAGLLHTLRTHQRALPPGSRAAFEGAVLATRDALRLTAADATLGRDAYDARQAAREDLPEVLRVYHAAPRSAAVEQELRAQLGVIEGRMRQVAQARAEVQGRALRAHRRYLEDKYAGPQSPEPEDGA